MTIEDVNPFTTPDTISADLSTTYAFAFKIKEGEESSVLAQVTATDGTITYPVYNTDYSIVRATDPLVGGTAQFLTAQPTGAKVVWYRKTPRNQGTTLPNQGAYKAEVVEGMIDKVAALGQELVRDVDLALGYPLGTDLDNYSAVLPVPAADKYIVGKNVGGKLTYVESTLSESNLTTYHTEALAAQTAAEAAQAAAEAAETNAETAETNAETAETNAETAQTAAEAAQALAETARDAAIAASETTAWGYTFDDGTADADPGTAKLRFNNATITSATELYISQSADEGDIGSVIDLWDASTSTTKATLKFINPTAKTNWVECEITGAATDDGTYWSIPIGNVVQGGSFSDDDTLLLGVQKHGDAGTGAVDSFNGRTGAVLPAVNDYDISDIQNAGALASLDTIGTSEMDANSVTLAEMEHGTAGDILYYGASGAPTRLVKGTADQILTQGVNYPEWADPSTPIFHIQDQKSSGTTGGTFTSGSWQTRDLNTSVENRITGASLSSNQITLPAGDYIIFGRAPAFRVGGHKLKLRNITDSTDDLIGSSEYSGSGSLSVSTSVIWGVISIASSKTFELQHRCVSTYSSTGLGPATSVSVVEVHAEILIQKVA